MLLYIKVRIFEINFLLIQVTNYVKIKDFYNERIEKMHQKYLFTTVEKLKMGHDYFCGRSIKEIQE